MAAFHFGLCVYVSGDNGQLVLFRQDRTLGFNFDYFLD